jgi:hypothetical protein
MGASLRPAVSGATPAARNVTVLHVAGLLAGSALMGLVLAVAGAAVLSAGLRPAVNVLVGIAVLLSILQCAGVRLPQSRWQVPEYWRRTLDGGVLPVAYGAILGLGVFTAVVVGAFWVFVAAAPMHTAPVVLLAWGAYGLGRSIGFVVSMRIERLDRLMLSGLQRKLLILATAILATVAVV